MPRGLRMRVRVAGRAMCGRRGDLGRREAQRREYRVRHHRDPGRDRERSQGQCGRPAVLATARTRVAGLGTFTAVLMGERALQQPGRHPVRDRRAEARALLDRPDPGHGPRHGVPQWRHDAGCDRARFRRGAGKRWRRSDSERTPSPARSLRCRLDHRHARTQVPGGRAALPSADAVGATRQHGGGRRVVRPGHAGVLERELGRSDELYRA